MMRLTTKITWRHAALGAIVLVSLATATVFLAVPSVHAQDVMTGLKSAAGAAGLPGKPSGGFEAAIGAIIGSVMGLIGTILFVYMLYGGFKWMTAGGDTKAVTDAQAIIRNAIIGIAIIVFAYTLTSFVINTLSSAGSGATPAATTGGQTTQAGNQCGQGTYDGYQCGLQADWNTQSTQQPSKTLTCQGSLNCGGGAVCCILK